MLCRAVFVVTLVAACCAPPVRARAGDASTEVEVEEALPYCVVPSAIDAVPFRPYAASLHQIPLHWNGGVSAHDWSVQLCAPGHALPAPGAAWGAQMGCERPAFAAQFRPAVAAPAPTGVTDASPASSPAVPSNLCEVAFDVVLEPPVWRRLRDTHDVVTGTYASSAAGYNLSVRVVCSPSTGDAPTAAVVRVDFPPRHYNMTVYDAAACARVEAVWELAPLQLAAIVVLLATAVGVAYRLGVNRLVHGRRGWAMVHRRLGEEHQPVGYELAPRDDGSGSGSDRATERERERAEAAGRQADGASGALPPAAPPSPPATSPREPSL